jgi:hypothetical protein
MVVINRIPTQSISGILPFNFLRTYKVIALLTPYLNGNYVIKIYKSLSCMLTDTIEDICIINVQVTPPYVAEMYTKWK